MIRWRDLLSDFGRPSETCERRYVVEVLGQRLEVIERADEHHAVITVRSDLARFHQRGGAQ